MAGTNGRRRERWKSCLRQTVTNMQKASGLRPQLASILSLKWMRPSKVPCRSHKKPGIKRELLPLRWLRDPIRADIVASEMNDGSTAVAGQAESQTNLLTNQFISVTVRLNHYYLSNPNYGYSYERIVHTAEHELGHAIWFGSYQRNFCHAASRFLLWNSAAGCDSCSRTLYQ